MKINEFDNLIKDKFEQTELAYNPANWGKLTQELSSTRGGRVINWTRSLGIAASLLLSIAAFTWILTRNDKVDTVASVPAVANDQPAKVHHQKAVPVPTTEIAETSNISERTTATPPRSASKLAGRGNTIPASIATANIEPSVPASTEKTEQQPIAETKTGDTKEHNDISIQPAPNKTYVSNEPFRPEPVIEQQPKGRTHLSITGGLNYGSLNTGYAAGINARQKLGRKVYIEGDLALVSNKSEQASSVTPTQYNAYATGTAGRSAVANSLTQAPSNFLYLQFNPSLGLQVHKKLSFSVGADLQRLLDHNNKVKTLVYQSDDLKLIPGTDVGLTGKTEYNVSNRIRAGVLYREGINNFINGSDDYFDRRYLQVQLKFRVLGK